MNAKDQVKKAAGLGAAAYHRGVNCAPALDQELIGMFGGRCFNTPRGEASTVDLFKAWSRAWVQESLKATEGRAAA